MSIRESLYKKLNSFFLLKDLVSLTMNFPFDEKKIKKLQEKKLKVVVEKAYEYEFYKKRFDDARVKPSDIKTGDDLLKLPPLTKADYREFIQSEVEKNPDKVKGLFKDSTSGSSGNPLIVYYGQREKAVNYAKWIREFVLNGHNLVFGKIFCVIPETRVVKRDSILQKFGLVKRHTMSQTAPMQEIVEKYNEMKPDLIYTSKSVFVQMALYSEKNNITLHKPNLYIPGAEMMDEISLKLIQKSFGVEGYAETYGCTETGIIGFKLKNEREKFNLCHDTNIFNILDDDMNKSDMGNIYITSLFQLEFPIINYMIGDLVESKEENGLTVLTKINGRTNDFIIGKDNELLSYHFFSNFKKINDVVQFTVTQYEDYSVEIKLVRDYNSLKSNEEIEAEILKEYGSKFEEKGLNYKFVWVDEIKPNRSGKIKMITSLIN